jgi:truncated hemoglobin YjbI/tellurite resistance-related uncharacterized protein
MTADTDFTEARLARLVDSFYARVRQDALIGPLFNAAITDWPEHLDRMQRFWSAVMRTSGRYKGNPVAAHVKHRAAIAPGMFDRWLALWRKTTAEQFAPESAALLQTKAERIAANLQSALSMRPAGTPYRSTQIFDEDTLPRGLRGEHRIKAGTWGAVHLLDGEIALHFADPPRTQLVSPDRPAIIGPEETHWVEPRGPFRMRIDFHDSPPALH